MMHLDTAIRAFVYKAIDIKNATLALARSTTAIFTPHPAGADPVTAWVTTSLVSAGLSAGTAAWVAAAIVHTATFVATTALSMALAPKPQFDGNPPTEVPTTGDTTPMKFIMGRFVSAGQFLIPPYTYTTRSNHRNQWMVYVMALSDKKINNVLSVIVDGEAEEFHPADYPVETADGRNKLGRQTKGRLGTSAYFRWHLGDQTEADPVLVEQFKNHEQRPWTTDHRLKNVAYIVSTFGEYDKAYAGNPNVKYIVEGISVYDPRRDSTVAGGNGPQRWEDESTWTYSDNPAVLVYNLTRGVRIDSSIYGIGAKADKLPLSNWMFAMNECDLPGNQPDSNDWRDDIKKYRAGLEISLSDEPLDAIQEILKSCGGIFSEMGGYYYLHIGSGVNLPAATITDDIILTSEGMNETPFKSIGETKNTVRCTYPSHEKLWEAVSANPYTQEEWLKEDQDQELVADVKITSCPYPQQINRLVRQMAKQQRNRRMHNIVLPPAYIGLKLQETIVWNSPSRFYNNKTFTIEALSIDPTTLCSLVTLLETDVNAYDVDAVADAQVPIYPDSGYTIPVIEGVLGFVAEGIAIADDNGKPRRAAIKIDWDKDNDFEGLKYEVRTDLLKSTIITGTEIDSQTGSLILSNNVLPNQTYGVRVSAHSKVVETQWSEWISVTTPDIKLGADDIEFDGMDIIADVTEKVEEAIQARDDSQVARDAAKASEEAAALAQGRVVDLEAATRLNLDKTEDAATKAETAAELADARAKAIALLQGEIQDAASQTAADKAATDILKKAVELARDEVRSKASTVDGLAQAVASDVATTKTYRDEAEGSAGSAAAAVNEVRSVIASASLIPHTLSNQGANFTSARLGAPDAVPNLSNPNYTFHNETGVGEFVRIPAGVQTTVRDIMTKEVLAYQPGQSFTISVRVRASAALATGKAQFLVQTLDGNYAGVDGIIAMNMSVPTANTWIEREIDWTVPNNTGRAYVRFGVKMNPDGADADIDFNIIRVQNTSVIKAAASSATSAATSKSDAEKAATASQNSRVGAESAYANTVIVKDETVRIKEAVDATLVEATRQAGLSANSSTVSGQHASAAANTLTQVRSISNTISQTATAITLERQRAESASANAASYRDQTLIARDDARGSASEAERFSGISVQASANSALHANNALTHSNSSLASSRASANSATQASASATKSGEESAISTSERVKAETARAQSQGFSNTASSAAQTATAAAASASNASSQSVTARNQSQGFANASAASALLSKSYADESSVNAQSARDERLAANTAKAGAETARNQSVAASQNSASYAALASEQASVVSTLTATGTGVLKDQFLGHGTSGWGTWTTAPAWSNSTVYPVGRQARFNVNATTQAGLSINSDNAAWTGLVGALAYRVDIEYTLQSGSLNGAGVLFDWLNTAGNSYRSSARLDDMIRGQSRNGQIMTASAILKRPDNFTGTISRNTIYVMANYNSNGIGPLAASDLRIHRISVSVATAEETGSGVVGDMIAAATSETKAYTDAARGALTTQVNNVSAVANRAAANVTTLTSAVANINGDLSSMYVIKASAGSGNSATLGLYAGNGPAAGSAIRMDADRIIARGTIDGEHINANSIIIRNQAQIQNLILGTSLIAPNAISRMVNVGKQNILSPGHGANRWVDQAPPSITNKTESRSNYYDYLTATINCPAAYDLYFWISMTAGDCVAAIFRNSETSAYNDQMHRTVLDSHTNLSYNSGSIVGVIPNVTGTQRLTLGIAGINTSHWTSITNGSITLMGIMK